MAGAMIWGASGGIGRALVSTLVAEGWDVVGVCRQDTELDALTPHVIAADVTVELDVRQAVMAAAQSVGEVALWIYSVGDIASTKVGDTDLATWQRLVGANLDGAFLATRHSLPLLSDDAHLIYLGARHERLRLPGLGAYAAAKAGLEAFAEALAKEERRKRVTVVRPGAVDTPLWDKTPLRLPKDALSPQAVAAQIMQAHHQGHKGVLDIG